MRGDRPLPCFVVFTHTKFTPHARGSTPDLLRAGSLGTVYPACAGIDLIGLDDHECIYSLPRMRGDRPIDIIANSQEQAFTPHARGSTHSVGYVRGESNVYPACAGIDPGGEQPCCVSAGLPRMRGDRPERPPNRQEHNEFTPHARGSTGSTPARRSLIKVYPACAGIDRVPFVVLAFRVGLPRMRGDRPLTVCCAFSMCQFTPHARGSTVFI